MTIKTYKDMLYIPANIKFVHDVHRFRLDYQQYENNVSTRKRAYARIRRMYLHKMYPGGPEKILVLGAWYKDEGLTAEGLYRVSVDPSNGIHHHSRFQFLTNCYSMPVAVWPADPFKRVPQADPASRFYLIIDRNQDEDLD